MSNMIPEVINQENVLLCHKIYEFVKNREKTKSDIRREFHITESVFTWLLIRLTWMYPVYEDDTGRIIGVLNV